ncbi:MAG: lipocalin family protein [Candidatus Binatia bacterium]
MKTLTISAAFTLTLFITAAPARSQSCGNGIVESGEACDDGGGINGDGCSAYCETETSQDKAQRNCLVALTKSASGLPRAQAKELSRCITNTAKSIGDDPAVCWIADRRGRIEKAKGKVASVETRSCSVLPDFGFWGASVLNDATSKQQLALATDVFGIDLSAVTTDFLTNCSGVPNYERRKKCARCQASVVRGYEKIFDAKLSAVAKCKKSGLGSGYINSRARLEECLDAIATDSRGKIARATAKLSRTAARKCSNPVAFLPGTCGGSPDAATFAACVDAKVECRVCRMINAAEGTGKDCDTFDDGLANNSCSYGAAANPMCMDSPTGQVVFPADEAVHAENLEWWYWTGHLQTADGRWFGFEHVFFITRINGAAFQMVNHSITDISAGRFEYDVKLGPWDGHQPELGFDFSQDGLTAQGYDGVDLLHGQLPGSTMDIQLRAIKSPVLQHGDGYQDYPTGGFTYYYSRERMEISGSLVVDETPLQVTGLGWFDHQWGDLLQISGAGWDWFGIQLDDDREIMAAIVHDTDGPVLVTGSITDADCSTTELLEGQVVATSLGQWTSPTTGCVYPMGWDLQIDGINLTLTPVLEDQELITPVSRYWEGAAVVSGDASGRAYVELVGYCP